MIPTHGLPDEGLSLRMEVQIEYESDAFWFFGKDEECFDAIGFQLVYFCFEFLFDQLSYVRNYGQNISDSLFVKDRLIGVSNDTTFNTETYFMGAMNSTLQNVQDLLSAGCGEKLGPDAIISLLKSFNETLNTSREESVELVDYLKEALEVVDADIAKFQPALQDPPLLVVAPQWRSPIEILRETIEEIREDMRKFQEGIQKIQEEMRTQEAERNAREKMIQL